MQWRRRRLRLPPPAAAWQCWPRRSWRPPSRRAWASPTRPCRTTAGRSSSTAAAASSSPAPSTTRGAPPRYVPPIHGRRPNAPLLFSLSLSHVHLRFLILASCASPSPPPQMWPGLIQKAKDGGLDVIQTYVFWNGHEPVQGQVLSLSPHHFFFFFLRVLG